IETVAIHSPPQLVGAALLARKFACRQSCARAGEYRGRLDLETLRFGHRGDPLPRGAACIRIRGCLDLLGRDSLRRPFRMNLVAAPFQVDIELGFELADYLEPDVAERANEVGEHRDL